MYCVTTSLHTAVRYNESVGMFEEKCVTNLNYDFLLGIVPCLDDSPDKIDNIYRCR